MLRGGCTALRKRADHRSISLMNPTLNVFHPCRLLSTVVRARSVIGILHAAHPTTRLLMVPSRSACLRMNSPVRSRSVNVTQFLAIQLMNFLFAFDARRVIPPRNNALAPWRADRLIGAPPPHTEPAGAAAVSALTSCR